MSLFFVCLCRYYLQGFKTWKCSNPKQWTCLIDRFWSILFNILQTSGLYTTTCSIYFTWSGTSSLFPFLILPFHQSREIFCGSHVGFSFVCKIYLHHLTLEDLEQPQEYIHHYNTWPFNLLFSNFFCSPWPWNHAFNRFLFKVLREHVRFI